MLNKYKLIRVSTVPISLNLLLKGQLAFLNQYFEVIAVSGEDHNLREVEIREKVRTYPIKMNRQINLFNDFKSLILLYLYFKKEKPHIVHSMTPKAGLLSMVAARLAGVPVRMHTFTGLIFPTSVGFKKKVLIITDKILCWSATNIYPEGKGVRQDLLDYKITSKPLHVLANGNVNGINLEFFDPAQISELEKENLRKNLAISTQDFVFVFIGRLAWDKGVNELVSAFSKMKNQHLKLLLIGPSEAELDPLSPETIAEMNSNENIILTGFIRDVRPYLAISSVLVLPSYREGFPNAVLQAGAMNLPSIVTDINGSNEIITDKENGLVVPAQDSESLFQSMSMLFSDNELYNDLRDNARPSIGLKFKQSLVWNALLAEYNQLCSKNFGSKT